MILTEPSLLTWSDLKKIIGKHRTDFRSVKYLLNDYHSRKATIDDVAKRKALLELSDVCLGVLDPGTPGKRSDKHLTGLRKVLSDVFHLIAYLDYVARKQTPASPLAKDLRDAYAHERTNFERENKAKHPAGASWVSDALHLLDPKKPKTPLIQKAKTDFDKLSYSEFMTLHRELGGLITKPSVVKQTVHFARRDERLRELMVVPVAGRLFTTTGCHPGNGLYLYAMDRFKNLFIKKYSSSNTEPENLNHSSLCAGRPVICAGEMEFANGTITFITCNSGHYKPSTSQFLALLSILETEYGLALEQSLTEISNNSEKFKAAPPLSALKQFRAKANAHKRKAVEI